MMAFSKSLFFQGVSRQPPGTACVGGDRLTTQPNTTPLRIQTPATTAPSGLRHLADLDRPPMHNGGVLIQQLDQVIQILGIEPRVATDMGRHIGDLLGADG